MASYDYGKQDVAEWIMVSIKKGSTCLDVGACDGKWFGLVGNHLTMDAVEVWEPYVHGFDLKEKYRNVYVRDISDFTYAYYDLILFGDVIEHMEVEQAQKVLAYALKHSGCVIVGVPFQYSQGAINDNPYEVHIQNDLTPELFEERYPGFELLMRAATDYYYYVG